MPTFDQKWALKFGSPCRLHHALHNNEEIRQTHLYWYYLENKYKKDLIKKKTSSEDNLDLDLTGLISDDVALAVRAELMRFSDVFDTYYF